MSNKAGKEAGEGAGLDKALGFAGVGMDVVSLGMSLAESGKQAAAMREAQRQAEISTKMQIQQQQQNFFEAMRVPTEAYDRALREGTVQQQQALMGLQEADTRNLLGGVGKVQAAAGDYNAQNRDAMAQQMFELQKLQAQEKMLNADDLAKIYEERTKGAQLAAASAEKAKFGLLNNAFRAGKGALLEAEKLRKEYKKAKNPPISNTGANISGVTGTGINSVDVNSQSPVGSMFANQNSEFNFPNYSFGPQPYTNIYSSVSTPQTQQIDWSQDPNNWQVNPF
jgi:hypothetical protein